MVFQAREAVAPEVSRALVAVVDFACVGEVQAGYGGEFFACVRDAGEDRGAGADSGVEDLVVVG